MLPLCLLLCRKFSQPQIEFLCVKNCGKKRDKQLASESGWNHPRSRVCKILLLLIHCIVLNAARYASFSYRDLMNTLHIKTATRISHTTRIVSRFTSVNLLSQVGVLGRWRWKCKMNQNGSVRLFIN